MVARFAAGDLFQVPRQGPKIDTETRNRIRLSLAAAAYEIFDEVIMSDAEFDSLARAINLKVSTRRPDLDKFFRQHFNASTGMWIHNHPELARLKEILRDTFGVK